MVKIRLKRLGYKKNPIYRIIVIDDREKREGRAIQELGHYNPKRKELKLDKTAASEWIKKGAQPTETVKYLIDNSDENGNLVRKTAEEQKLSKKAKTKIEEAKKAEVAAAAKAKEEAEKAKSEAAAKAKEEAENVKAEAAAPAAETTGTDETKEEATA